MQKINCKKKKKCKNAKIWNAKKKKKKKINK